MLRRHLRNPRNRCILLASRLVCDGTRRRNRKSPRESDTLAWSLAAQTSYLPHSLNAVAMASVSGKQVGAMLQQGEIAPRERNCEPRLYKESCDCTSTRAEHAAPYSASVTTRQRYQRGAISTADRCYGCQSNGEYRELRIDPYRPTLARHHDNIGYDVLSICLLRVFPDTWERVTLFTR